MLMGFKVIYEMLEEINQSVNKKEELLRRHLKDPIFGPTFKKVLEYMSDNIHIFKLRKVDYCIYFEDIVAAEHQNTDGIFEMLDYLSGNQNDTTIKETEFLNKISSVDVETVEVVTRILNKFSGCGLTNIQIIEILEEKEE